MHRCFNAAIHSLHEKWHGKSLWSTQRTSSPVWKSLVAKIYPTKVLPQTWIGRVIKRTHAWKLWHATHHLRVSNKTTLVLHNWIRTVSSEKKPKSITAMKSKLMLEDHDPGSNWRQSLRNGTTIHHQSQLFFHSYFLLKASHSPTVVKHASCEWNNTLSTRRPAIQAE